MKLLINYANKTFAKSQKLNSETGKTVGLFDKVISYSPKDIDAQFYAKNKKILSQKKGGGYWLWKPYFIKKALATLNDGDFLFYADSGSYFVNAIDPLIDISQRDQQDIIVFELSFIEKVWSKRDAFILMDCDEPEYTDSKQRQASFSLWRKSKIASDFVNQWLDYAQDERIITDIENQCGYPNHPEFINNRHDQTIFSLLSKKYGLNAYRDPSHNRNNSKHLYLNSDYEKLLKHTRKRNFSLQTIKKFIPKTIKDKLKNRRGHYRNNKKIAGIKTPHLKNYAKIGNGRWLQVYDKLPNKLPEPVFYGALRADMAKNTVTEFAESGVLELEQAILIQGKIISREGYVLSDFKPANKLSRKKRKALTTQSVRNLDGTTLLLDSDGGVGNPNANYGHCLLDSISRLHLVERAGFDWSAIDHILGPKRTDNITFLLQKISVPLEKYISLTSCDWQMTQMEKLLIPSFPGAPRNTPQWVVEFYRQKILPNNLVAAAHRRIYITREGFARNPTNQDAVYKILHNHNFEILNATTMTEEQIVNKCGEAAIIVGAHGAGLTAIVFCQPNTKLLELVPTDHVQPYYYTLSHAAKMQYNCLVCPSTHNRGKNPLGPSPYDFYVDETALDEALSALT